MTIKQKIKTIGYLSFLSVAVVGNSVTAGSIVDSKHNFSNSGWNPTGEICVVCHTPHNARDVADAPLWNHDTTTTVFDLYDSPTFDGATTIGQPAGSSIMCLSCHDGTVALDAFGDFVDDGNPVISGNANLGTSLADDHPISFTYDQTLIDADGALNPLDTAVTIGIPGDADSKDGTIASLLLFDGQMQCASCHDVHNKFTDGDSLLRINNAGSALCLTCHDK